MGHDTARFLTKSPSNFPKVPHPHFPASNTSSHGIFFWRRDMWLMEDHHKDLGSTMAGAQIDIYMQTSI